MPKSPKRWVYSPPKPAKLAIPSLLKAEVTTRANELVETELKPQHVQPPPDEPRNNYIANLYTKWFRGDLVFYATYIVPSPDATMPSFEARFARLSYTGGQQFNLAFMHYTGEWVAVYEGLSLDEALTTIRDDPFFVP